MKFRLTLLALSLGAMAAVTSIGASAEGTPTANIEHGKTLAYTCHGCHGIPNYKNAYPNYSVPRLGNQNITYLVAALDEYANGSRPHATMHAQAATLDAQDKLDVAGYLHAQGANPDAPTIGTPPAATQTCVACHGANGAKTISDEYPVLAGQQPDYIVQALKDYKSGKRKNPIMAGIVAGVEEKDFASIAQFFSQQHALCSTDELRKYGHCQAK